MATISTIIRLVDNVTGPLKAVNTSVGQTTKGFESLAGRIVSVNSAIQLFSTVSNLLGKGLNTMNEYVSSYQKQIENEVKLESVMKQRMNATDEQINSIKELAKVEQQRGVYGDEMILQGAQELATYVSQKEALDKLIPAMGHLLAQQRGVNASFQDMQSVATMMGKVIGGQLGGLSRLGYIFSEDEKQMLKTGTEMERASVLAKIITDNVSEMNYALRGTEAGGIIAATNAMSDFKEEIGATLQPLTILFSQIKLNIIKNFKEPLLEAINSFLDYLPTLIHGLLNIATVMVAIGTVWLGVWAVMNAPLIGIMTLIIMLGKLIFDFTGGFASAGEIIGGIVGGIKAVIINLYNIAFNIIAGLTNGIITAIDFIINTWRKLPIWIYKGVDAIMGFVELLIDAWNAFPTFLYKMINKVMGWIEPLAKLIDKASRGRTHFAESIQEGRQNLQDYIKGKESGKTELESRKALQAKISEMEANLKTEETEKFAYKPLVDIVEEIKAGAKVGSDMEKKLDEWLQYLQQIRDNTGEVASTVGGDGTINTSEQNEIKIDDDYKKLLSEQATRQYQLSYATITPDFSIQNMNVSSEADVDSIFERIVDKIAELSQTYIKKGA